MSFTYDELKHKTVAQMREIAAEIDHEALQGYTQLNKEHLLVALCKAFGLDTHAHHETVGIDKSKIKAQIKDLKKKRDEALAAKDHKQLKQVRREIHGLKHSLRSHTV